ncbi:MAG: hypothetical protein WBP59_06520 [Ilumatobacteraceae bacterium]
MNVAASARLMLARRPWLYWVFVASITAVIVFAVRQQLAAVDETKATWGTTRDVLMADRSLAPGDPIAASIVALPDAMIPVGALSDVPSDALLQQRVAAGEVLLDIDIAVGRGPAARAPAGSVVVALIDPLSRALSIGLEVQVAADGLILSERATVVDVADDVVFVAVEPGEAASVAAAAHAGSASLLYLP